MKKHLCAMALILFACIHVEPARAANVADLNWMSGHWVGEMWGGVIEEVWTESSGDSLMGMFRYVKDGKIQLYEFMTIEQGPDGPIFHLRHFNSRLIGWEDKENPVLLPLSEAKEQEASFLRNDAATKITYRRNEDGTLTVILERDKKSREVFSYRLKK